MQRLLVSICLAVPLAAWAAPLYRWVDADGIPHFSDRRPDDPTVSATRVEIGNGERRSATGDRPEPGSDSAPGPGGAAAKPVAVQPDPAPAPAYERLTLVSPADGAIVNAFDGTVGVILDVQPTVASGHRLRLYFDGVRQTVTPAPTIPLAGVAPGEHTLFVEIVDAGGRPMARTETHRFTARATVVAP